MNYKAYYKIDGVDSETPIYFTASNLVDAQHTIRAMLKDLHSDKEFMDLQFGLLEGI